MSHPLGLPPLVHHLPPLARPLGSPFAFASRNVLLSLALSVEGRWSCSCNTAVHSCDERVVPPKTGSRASISETATPYPLFARSDNRKSLYRCLLARQFWFTQRVDGQNPLQPPLLIRCFGDAPYCLFECYCLENTPLNSQLRRHCLTKCRLLSYTPLNSQLRRKSCALDKKLLTDCSSPPAAVDTAALDIAAWSPDQ